MKMAVVGAGVVGLATGAGFAELGHFVKIVDIDAAKIAQLGQGRVSLHEPGLEELIVRNLEAGRLTFGTETEALFAEADLAFLAVGTPSDAQGEMKLEDLWSAVDRIEPWTADNASPPKILAVKSTVPVGTAERMEARLGSRLPSHCRVEVACVPEFMRQGMAVRDFFEPARIVVGAASGDTADCLVRVHGAWSGPVVVTDRRSAELAKLAANAFLAVKISFANEIAALAEQTGADYPDIADVLGMDPRIGPSGLGAGLGFGGSCLPKDARALVSLAEQSGAPQTLVGAAIRTNTMQPLRMVRKLEAALSDPGRCNVALLGLAFKPGTGDMREAPSLRLIAELLRRHPDIGLTAYDPAVNASARALLPEGVRVCGSAEEALKGADAAILVTEWPEFGKIPADCFHNWMKRPIILDGRNALDASALNAHGVICIGMGRLPAAPAEPARLPEKPVHEV